MNDLQNNAALTLDLVRAFAKEIASIGCTWHRAFLRIAVGTGYTEAKASYVGPAGATIVDVLAHKAFFHCVNEMTGPLFATLESARPIKVALVVLNADFSYELMYEYDDPNQWAISKLNGRTGVPSGV
jgi:hypothetical protein